MLSLYEFETVEAPIVDVPAGADLSSDAAPSVESGASGEGDTPAPATVEAPAWDADNPAFREAVQQETQALIEAQLARLAPPSVEQPVEAQIPNLDPFDENFAQNLATLLQQTVQGAVSPLLETAQQQQAAANEAHWNDVVQDVIADETSRNGDLTTEELEALNLIGVSIMPEMHGKYGQTPRAVEATVHRAAAQVRAIITAAEERGIERYKNELGTLGGARTELGAGGTGGGMQGLTQAMTPQQVIERHAGILRGTASA